MRALSDALLRIQRLDQPPRIVILGVSHALEQELTRPPRFDEPVRAPRELDDRAADAQPRERSQEVRDHEAESALSKRGTRPQPEHEDLLEAEPRPTWKEQNLTQLAGEEASASEVAKGPCEPPIQEPRRAAHRKFIPPDGASEELCTRSVEASEVWAHKA